MKTYWKTLTFILLVVSQALFSPQVMAASDPIYTGFFSNKALEGYDTVAYFTEGKAVEGKSNFKVKYQGAEWWFINKEHLDMFTDNPEKYAPQYGGYCAWAIGEKNQLAPGDPHQWTIHQGKLYINYDQSVQDTWLPKKDSFIKAADKNWPSILD